MDFLAAEFFVPVDVNTIPARGSKNELPSTAAISKNNQAKVAAITLGKSGMLAHNQIGTLLEVFCPVRDSYP